MDNHAQRILQYVHVAGVGPDYISHIRSFESMHNRWPAMCFEQSARPPAGIFIIYVTMSDDTGQKEIMQHDHTRIISDQIEHVRMEMRIAEMIKNPVECICMLPEPIDRADRIIGYNSRIADPILIHDHVDVLMARKLGKQFGAVITDAAGFGRKR